MDSLLEDNRTVILKNICEDLRSTLPRDAMLPSETFTVKKLQACAQRTLHVDSFLFSDSDLDALSEEGEFSRSFCLSCGSTLTSDLQLVSHSFSVMELRFMYLNVLPDLRQKVLVDVGSRTGAVLYAGHVFSSAAKLIGVELNQDFADIQNQIIHKYGFEDRVQVVHSDVLLQGALILNADVLIMNNVFEFFLEPQHQLRCWRFLVENFRRRGSLLVTVPSLEDSFSRLQEPLPCDWLEQLPVNYDLFLTRDVGQNEAFREIHLYRVR